jgi:hypothetical protein
MTQLLTWNRAAEGGADIQWAAYAALEIIPAIAGTLINMADQPEPSEPPDTWAIYGIRADGIADHLHDADSRHEALNRAADVSAAFGLPFYVRGSLGPQRPAATLLRPFYDLSTAHITEGTAKWLESHAQQRGEYGFLVHVPSEVEAGRYPPDLARLLDAVRGEADYLLLDRDGMTDDRLPTYDW